MHISAKTRPTSMRITVPILRLTYTAKILPSAENYRAEIWANECNGLLTTICGMVKMAAMRKASGIALISLGAIGLAICGIVLLRLALPIPGFLLMWSVLFLTIGVVLLLQRPKAPPSK